MSIFLTIARRVEIVARHRAIGRGGRPTPLRRARGAVSEHLVRGFGGEAEENASAFAS